MSGEQPSSTPEPVVKIVADALMGRSWDEVQAASDALDALARSGIVMVQGGVCLSCGSGVLHLRDDLDPCRKGSPSPGGAS